MQLLVKEYYLSSILDIEVTKNYDMVMNKKFFNLIFFVTFFYL